MKKKNITPHNNNEERHGYWIVYHDANTTRLEREYGKLYFTCTYHNGIEIGYDEVNYEGGDNDKTFYIR